MYSDLAEKNKPAFCLVLNDDIHSYKYYKLPEENLREYTHKKYTLDTGIRAMSWIIQ